MVDHIRLFPVREDARWTYRVHEQILPALRQAKVPVRWTNLTVRHTGYVDPALRAKKLDHPGRPFKVAARWERIDLLHVDDRLAMPRGTNAGGSGNMPTGAGPLPFVIRITLAIALAR